MKIFKNKEKTTMTDDKETTNKAHKAIQTGQPITIPEIYTNTAIVNFSPYEFEITFGLGSSNYKGVKPVVNLRMSPQFTKEFTRLLVDNINLYQENVGKIVIPETNKQ